MTNEQKLAEAESAYHQLQTGKMAVSVMKDGRRVDFNRANIHQLKNYIDELKRLVGLTVSRRLPPAGVVA